MFDEVCTGFVCYYLFIFFFCCSVLIILYDIIVCRLRRSYFFFRDVRYRVVLNVGLPNALFRIRYNTIGFRFDSRGLDCQQTVVYYVFSLGQSVTRGNFLGFRVFVYRGFFYGRIQNAPEIGRPVNRNNIICALEKEKKKICDDHQWRGQDLSIGG